MRVSVIGSGRATQKSEAYAAARAVGRLLAERGHTVVCGGRGGVMEAACRGSTEYDGDSEAQRASSNRATPGDITGTQGVPASSQNRTVLATASRSFREPIPVEPTSTPERRSQPGLATPETRSWC